MSEAAGETGRRFFDGRTARAQEVRLRHGADGLELVSGDGPQRVWPYADLDWADRAAMRLSCAQEPDARLQLRTEDLADLTARAPQLADDAQRRKTVRLVAGLTAAGASVAALVFFGIPAAAVPLARMTSPDYEQQLGANVEAQFDLALDACEPTAGEGLVALTRLGDRIAEQADIPYPVNVAVADVGMVNAFALPGGRVWLTRGLIEDVRDPNELAAVLAHEIAHVEGRDVLVNLYRAMGYGMVLDAVVGGGSGAGQQIIMLGANVTEMKFSRDVEARADRRGLELLNAAGLDSRGMATFFERLGKVEGEGAITRYTELINSHPATAERAQAARALQRNGEAPFTPAQWKAVQAICD